MGATCFYDMNHNGHNAADSIGVYSTFLFTDVITQIFEGSDPSEPLFAYLSWQNVHAPLDPPPKSYFTERELSVLDQVEDPHRRAYASMTIILDNAMKKVVGDMSRLGFYDDSVLIVMSDNGGCSCVDARALAFEGVGACVETVLVMCVASRERACGSSAGGGAARAAALRGRIPRT